jgi:hypothetical protein
MLSLKGSRFNLAFNPARAQAAANWRWPRTNEERGRSGASSGTTDARFAYGFGLTY